MENKITLTHDEIMASLAKIAGELINKSDNNGNVIDDNYVSPFAAWLLSKADKPVVRKNGIMLSKSEVDETTLDFTMGRTLTQEDAEATIRFIYDKSPYLSMFNSRTVDKLVVPIEGKSITKKNLVSNEQNGGAVATVNRRIVHNFGINLYLKNINLQKDIPLQTVVNNMYNPSFEAETMSDVAIALANDILLLATNGLEYASYASSENFYDLNKGFVRILQLADGKNTNTYGSVTVVGFNGQYLTPQKIDAVGCTGANYTAANLITLMRTMYKAMLPQYRNDSGNVWMMSQVDADLYLDSRSDMGFTSGAVNSSNTTREQVLTTGMTPNFMGHRIVVIPDMLGINETHEYQPTVPGAIIFGNPKNIDIAMSTRDLVTSTDYNARGTYGATYEYDFQGYMDVHVSKPESFVIAFNGAQISQPVLVTPTGAAGGNAGEGSLATSTYTVGKTWDGAATSATSKFHICCDNQDTVIVKSLTDITGAGYDTLAEALARVALDNDPLVTKVIEQNGYFLVAADASVYVRAYPKTAGNLVASTGITITVDLA